MVQLPNYSLFVCIQMMLIGDSRKRSYWYKFDMVTAGGAVIIRGEVGRGESPIKIETMQL